MQGDGEGAVVGGDVFFVDGCFRGADGGEGVLAGGRGERVFEGEVGFFEVFGFDGGNARADHLVLFYTGFRISVLLRRVIGEYNGI